MRKFKKGQVVLVNAPDAKFLDGKNVKILKVDQSSKSSLPYYAESDNGVSAWFSEHELREVKP